MLLVRTYLILLLLLASASAVRPFLRSIWTAWKMVHNKTYSMPQEEHLRMRIFANNYMFVRWHNERYYLGLETYSTGLNAFADLTLKEFVDQYLTLQPKQSDFWEDTITEVVEDYFAPAPKYIDWRKKGLVTPVKNQGQCGSCWAFSATGALEGQFKKKKGKLIPLSEQQLVDCSRVTGNEGCNGGLMDNAFRYWMRKGAESETNYPYTAKDGVCKFNENKTVVKVKMFRRVAEKNEEQLKLSVAKVGPISVGIDASSFGFQFYKSGIYEDTHCSQTNLDHGVLVVGYDEDKTRRKYWIVKNSWGEMWGQKGYIWMAREKNNMCGIATMASYPLV